MLEIFGVITGLVYIWLEIKKKSAMWIVGVVMAIAYIVLFAQEMLFAAMGLQVYYLAISIYGWWKWRRDAANVSAPDHSSPARPDKILLNKMGWKEALISSGLTVGLYFVSVFVFAQYTDHPQPQLDSLVSSLSVLGTYWLSRSYIQHWFLWIAANILSVGMYITQGLYPTSILYLVYVVAATYGYYHWRKRGGLGGLA